MTRIALTHTTRYTYDRQVAFSPHDIRLRPAAHTRAVLEAYAMHVTPANNTLAWLHDAYGNCMARVLFDEIADELRITVSMIGRLEPVNPFDFVVAEHFERFPFRYEPEEQRALLTFLSIDEHQHAVHDWIDTQRDALLAESDRTIDFIVGVNRAVAHGIRYETRDEPGVQGPDATLREARGSCRDSAWLLVEAFRRCGIGARFVSGYLVQLAAPPGDGGEEARAGADAASAGNGREGSTTGADRKKDSAAFHAWCEVYLPGAGWIGLDGTSGLLTAEGHIPLACAAEPEGAAPVDGKASRAHAQLAFDLGVVRLDDGALPDAFANAVGYRFRYRDAEGRWRMAVRPAALSEIQRHGEFEIVGGPATHADSNGPSR